MATIITLPNIHCLDKLVLYTMLVGIEQALLKGLNNAVHKY